MFEIDFLPVDSAGGTGSKSGDAITARFTTATGQQRIIVVDAGYADTGKQVVEHICDYYGDGYSAPLVDVVISTHPDQDHLNGLVTVVNELQVGTVLVHQPWLHHPDASDFSNLEAIQELVAAAKDRGAAVAEPFTGTHGFDGALRILGPTTDFYTDCVARHLAEASDGSGAARMSASTPAHWFTKEINLFRLGLSSLPPETLGEDGDSGPRNDSSVITLLTLDGQRCLLTGDAGIESLRQAAEAYEGVVGSFADNPLRCFQPPHHGSRRNLSPTVLDRILGPRGAPHAGVQGTGATVSAGPNDPKHPSSKVTNALLRRGVTTSVTAAKTICWCSDDAPSRGWVTVPTLPPLPEDD